MPQVWNDHDKGVKGTNASGAGMRVVALIIAKKSHIVLADWRSPIAEKYLSAHGGEILPGINGTVEEVLDKFEKENTKRQIEETEDSAPAA